MNGDTVKYLSKEQIKSILEGAQEEIKKIVIENATSQASWAVKDETAKLVRECVQEFFEEHIKADLQAAMLTHKNTIIEAGVTSANNMAPMLAEAMTKTLAEKLGNSWDRKKIYEVLLT